MKKQIIIAVAALGAFLFGIGNAQAQNHTATTTINIILADVISIHDGAENSAAIGGQVVLNFETAEHYNEGINAVVPNSLTVTSTTDFHIKVKANGTSFEGAGTESIPVDVMTIQVDGGTMGGIATPVELSTTDQTLVTNAPLGSTLTLDLDYRIPAAKSSSSDILGKPAGTYTQTVTYTATTI